MRVKLFSVLLVLCTITLAQNNNKHSFRSSLGSVRTGEGDLSGISLENEYVYSFSKRIEVGAAYDYCNFLDPQKDETLFQNEFTEYSNSSGLVANLYYKLISKDNLKMGIGLGPSLRYWSTTYITGPEIEYGGGGLLVPASNQYRDNFFALGYAISIYSAWSFTNRSAVFIKGKYHDNADGINVLGASFGLQLQF